jgi:hypothetical protein
MNADFQDKKIEQELKEDKAQSNCCQEFFNLAFSAFICVNLRPIRFLTAER